MFRSLTPALKFTHRCWIVLFLLGLVISACAHEDQPPPIPSPTPTRTLAPTLFSTQPVPTRTPVPAEIIPRQELSLDGAWEVVKVASLDDPIPSAGWIAFQVPGVLDGYNYERAWFQRKFQVPAGCSGCRVILKFGGVKYNSRVVVNGKFAGGHFNGYDAFEVDITPFILWKTENLLQVGVHDWTGVFSDNTFDPRPSAGDWEALRTAPTDRILSPIGGLYTLYGIWDSVSLKIVPPVHIDSLAVVTSLKDNRLDVKVNLKNLAGQSFTGLVQARIYEWRGSARDQTGSWQVEGEPVAAFPDQPASLAAGQEGQVLLSLSNPPLDAWSPNNPRLYILEVQISPAGDAIRERIGWREFTVQDGNFFLNGKKIHLLAASWWPDGARWTREQILAEWQATRAANVVAFRTHTQPWPRLWYEAADEVGLMMIPEAAIWNDDLSYRLEDERFWNNYAAHLTAMVETLGNHPSVVMWSLENELSGQRINDQTPALEERLADLGRLVKEIDPTRPITFESDGDPGNTTDVIGIHYPNEYPEYRLWPRDAYWMDQPRDIVSGGGFFWDRQPFLWDKTKPVYIGEYLWSPSSDPAPHTVFFGDTAYSNYRKYALQAKVTAWRMQIQAYRFFDASGHSPWAVKEEGRLDETSPAWVAVRDMYRPLAAFIRQPDALFFSGERPLRTVDLYNDTMTDLPAVIFTWSLLEGETRLAGDQQTFTMASGERIETVIGIPLPFTDRRRTLVLRLELSAEGQDPFLQETFLTILPTALDLENTPFTLYDPQGILFAALISENAPFNLISSLGEWDGTGTLVIAPSALSSSSPPASIPVIGIGSEVGESLVERVKDGGRILVLEQDLSIPEGTLPVRLTNRESTMAFIQAPGHPALAGLSDLDLRWWGADQLVSDHEPIRPTAAGVQSLVVSGGEAGLSHSPLIEIRQGQGVWMICQLQVGTKFQSEPVARILLGQMLAYLNEFEPPEGSVVYYPSNAGLTGLNANLSPLVAWDDLQLPLVRLAILKGIPTGIDFDRLRAFLFSGGAVLWDRPDFRVNDFLASLGSNVRLSSQTETAFRAEGKAPLLDFLLREDLYWIQSAPPHGYDAAELAPNARSIFVPQAESPPSGELIPASQDVDLSGTYVQSENKTVLMATNGTAAWTISLTADNLYEFQLVARGTPSREIYPLAQVFLDDLPVGNAVVNSETGALYRFFFRANAGVHRIAIRFENDAYDPPEDRNLILESYQVVAAGDTPPDEALTLPAALVEISYGDGRLILNAIEWDANSQNSLRGQRFFSGLLTGLGATTTLAYAPVVIEAEMFQPMPNYSLMASSSGNVAMYSNGYIQGQVTVAREGSYRVSIFGKGTPVADQYPIVQVELAGRILGQITIDSAGFEIHELITNLNAGEGTLRLSFVNDAWMPETGADRNVWIDRIEFEPIQ